MGRDDRQLDCVTPLSGQAPPTMRGRESELSDRFVRCESGRLARVGRQTFAGTAQVILGSPGCYGRRFVGSP